MLISLLGRDATQDFDDVGHSEEASKMMEEYYIGDLDPVIFRKINCLLINKLELSTC